MKIDLYLCYGGDVAAALRADPVVASQFKADAFRETISAITVDGESELFERILALTRGTSGLRITPECMYSAKELAQARYFEVLCRKALRVSHADNMANLEHVRELEPFRTAEGLAIKRMERIALWKAPVDPMTVAGLDDWAMEYLAGARVAELFGAAGFTGLELRPVVHRKTGAPHEGVYQLYAHGVMPPAERRLASVMRVGTKPYSMDAPIRVLGSLTYAFGDAEPADFNRTAEPLSSNQLADWVVSRKVVELFRSHKLKGWAFRPVMELGTAQQADHEARWVALREKIATGPNHHFAV